MENETKKLSNEEANTQPVEVEEFYSLEDKEETMGWKDKEGNELNAGDTVTLQGKVIGRHSGDRVSIEITPEQRVLVSTAACVKSGSKER